MAPGTRFAATGVGIAVVTLALLACGPDDRTRESALLAGAGTIPENPDAPRDSIRTRLRSDADDKWIEWHTGYGPTGRQASLPINNPPVVHADAATHMQDADPIIGVLVDGHARAYPWWFMTSGHLANDLIGGEPVLVTMCERCSGIAAFRSTLSGRMLDFRLAGIKDGTWFCADFQTRSFWHPFGGVAWRGPLEGRKLERLRTYQMRWGEWKREHPDTTVLLAGEEMRHRGHSRWGNTPKHPGGPFMLVPEALKSETPNPRMEWIDPTDVVFGLVGASGKRGKAYPLERVREAGGLLQEDFDGQPVVLVAGDEFQVGGYLRRVEGEVLDLKLQSDDPYRLVDQNGTSWDEWGQAVAGPGHGQMLALLDGYVTEWYEWLYTFPESDLLGHR